MSDNWYTDRRQNQRLEGLEQDLSHVSASLASARSSQRRLHAELSKVRGSLEQRLDRLSAAFDAFVEISDLRVTLGLFDAQGRIRHQARRLLAGTGTGGEVVDVDAYWLAPALVALGVAADGVTDADSLAAAAARDAHRAAVFHVLGTGLLGGRDTVTPAMLAAALPVPAQTLPLHQRATWVLAADGFFGEEGWELLRARGLEFTRGLDATATAAAVAAVRELGTAGAGRTGLPREFEKAGEITAVLDAGARLTALRTWVEEGLAGWTNEPAVEVDPVVRRALELLVDEGSTDELPLLARERELRAVIEGTGSEAAAWDGPAGETLSVLHADADDAGHPGRRAVAVRILGDHLLAAADELAEAARRPFPAKVVTRTRQGSVTLTATGPESLEAAHRRIESTARVSGQRRTVAYAGAGVAAVFLLLAVVAGWGWGFVALVALGVAGYQWVADGRDRAAAAAGAVTARTALTEEIDGRVAQLAGFRATAEQRRTTIDDDLAALRAALADGDRARVPLGG